MSSLSETRIYTAIVAIRAYGRIRESVVARFSCWSKVKPVFAAFRDPSRVSNYYGRVDGRSNCWVLVVQASKLRNRRNKPEEGEEAETKRKKKRFPWQADFVRSARWFMSSTRSHGRGQKRRLNYVPDANVVVLSGAGGVLHPSFSFLENSAHERRDLHPFTL